MSLPCSGPGRLGVLGGFQPNDTLSSGATTRIGLPDDPLYLVDTDPIQLGDLRLRHPIARQGTHASELRGWYRAGVAPDRPLPSYRFWLDRPFYHWRFHWHRRRDSENTRLALRFGRGERDGVLGGRCRIGRPGLRSRLKQVFCVSARPVDLFSISISARRPFRRQESLQRNR
jgi:hypothetical protein